MDLMARYRELTRQADWFAAAGYLIAAAEVELNAMMVMAFALTHKRKESITPDG